VSTQTDLGIHCGITTFNGGKELNKARRTYNVPNAQSQKAEQFNTVVNLQFCGAFKGKEGQIRVY